MSRLEEDVKSVTSRIATLETKSETVEGSLLTKTTEIADIRTKISTTETIRSQHQELRKVIDNHQRYLEKADSVRRENNVVVFGLQESENDNSKVTDMFRSIGCQNVIPEKMKRLGKPPTPPAENSESAPDSRPKIHPLLVTLKCENDRKNILITNSSKLKGSELHSTVYLKKDQTPQERKEWARLREVIAREKGRPENAGLTVKMDYRRRCVLVGDRVIEKGNFRFGPAV